MKIRHEWEEGDIVSGRLVRQPNRDPGPSSGWPPPALCMICQQQRESPTASRKPDRFYLIRLSDGVNLLPVAYTAQAVAEVLTRHAGEPVDRDELDGWIASCAS